MVGIVLTVLITVFCVVCMVFLTICIYSVSKVGRYKAAVFLSLCNVLYGALFVFNVISLIYRCGGSVW